MSNEPSNSKLRNVADVTSKKDGNMERNQASNATGGTPLDFNLYIYEHMVRAESSPDSARWLMAELAKALRAGEVVPPMLADYFAGAFESALAEPAKYCARALAEELHLTHRSRRPAHSWLVVGPAMSNLVRRKVSPTKAKVIMAAEYGIDERTALKYYKTYSLAKKAHDSIE